MSVSPRADWAPFDLIIFDCDSTLSAIEGIDELARWLGRETEVAALTNQAMNGEIPLEAVYGRRLELLQPTREHIYRLGQLYRDHQIPGAETVIAALLAFGREVFIVSGGLAEPVQDFGVSLGLPARHIHAVEMEYNQLAGRWWETWKHPQGRNPDERYLVHDGGPLTMGKGKAQIIRKIRAAHPGRAMLIGDGTSDLEAGAAVDLFVGFGGVVARDKVRDRAEVFVQAPHLAPIAPLALARPLSVIQAAPACAELYQTGLDLIAQGQVTFQNPAARQGLLQRLGL
jgi:phosphoserine phosphatase